MDFVKGKFAQEFQANLQSQENAEPRNPFLVNSLITTAHLLGPLKEVGGSGWRTICQDLCFI
jgi:hypothetical protein